MYKLLWVISGWFKLIYHIKLVGILKYNMFLNYYRVFTSRFILHSLLQIVISTLLPSYMLLNMIVNKWKSQLEPYVSCLCLFFKFNPTSSHKESQNVTYSWLFQSTRTQMSIQYVKCVGVWCIQFINNNCLTLKNHPLGILIPQIHPLKLIYPFINQNELNKMILPINICMAPGLRLRPTLYYNHQI